MSAAVFWINYEFSYTCPGFCTFIVITGAIMDELTEFDVIDKAGRPFTVQECNGVRWIKFISRLTPGGNVLEHMKMVKSLQLRDSDIMICTFPKSGTHWIWEIVAMLTRGKAEYEKSSKETAMLEFKSKEDIENLPEPRILNTHYPVSCLPTDLFKKRVKTIHVLRNPKDAIVSMFNHSKAMAVYPGSFEEFYSLNCGYGDNRMGNSWFNYVQDFDKMSSDQPELPILNLYYEDMKQDSKAEITKVANFLEVPYDDKLIDDIADKCSFDKLKKANDEVKEDSSKKMAGGKSFMYRKGIVGDWKNWFTVAMNEEFDREYENRMKDSKLRIRFTI